MMFRIGTLTALLLISAARGLANSPPDPPGIFEPAPGAESVSPWDVHMVSGPFSDPNPGDTHRCTDWEIRTAEERTLVWSAPCAPGALAQHIHLGDGSFHGVTALSYAASWVLRVRYLDSSGDPDTEASLWSEREFGTGEQMLIHPMVISGIADDPPPRWVHADGSLVEIAESSGSIEILSGESPPLARFTADRWQSFVPPESAPRHHPAIVSIAAGSEDLEIPETTLEIHDLDLVLRRIYLPAFALTPGATLILQVANDGATYYIDPTVPQFGSLARSSPVPWTVGSPALRIEPVATGFQLPVALAFAPSTSTDAASDAPWLYVAELYGAIKVIAKDGTISDYATGLLDFGPEGPFPGNGEQGIGGMAVHPLNGDLFVTLPLLDGEGAPAPRVIRLRSEDGGRTAARSEPVLLLDGLEHVASHQISNISIGPDWKLYVHVGDGAHTDLARSLDAWHGKILRLNMDGSAPADNPFYDSSDGITPRDYVYALGFRNPFGGAWRASDDALYVVDNGPGIDRFVQAAPGGDYGWDGTDEAMIANSLITFERAAPVRVAFLQETTAGGSGFPEPYLDAAVVTESGPTWSAGPQTRGKRVTLLRFDEEGSVSAEELVRYAGFGRGTTAGLALGEDGIYFTSLYPESSPLPFDRGASIFRIRYGGQARFTLRVPPDDPMTVEVLDQSDLAGASTRLWRFGDEAVASSASAAHTFTVPGVHEIRLRVGSEREDVVTRAFVSVGDSPGRGLRAEYFDGTDLEGDPLLTRIEGGVANDWGAGGPADMSADNFSVRWTGTIIPRITGRYHFDALADDGIRLQIGGIQVIDAWWDGSWESGGSIALVAGRPYEFRMEFFERGGDASVRLFWTPPFGERELVPPSVLYRPTGRGRIAGRTAP